MRKVMTKPALHVITAVMLLLLSACASVGHNIPREYSIAQNPEKGLVVFSLRSNLKAGNMYNNIYLLMHKAGSADELKDSTIIMYWAFGFEMDFGTDGRLVAVEMEPGEYEFFRTQLFMSGPKAQNQFRSRSFRVKQGKATYLGEFYAVVGYGLEPDKPFFANAMFMQKDSAGREQDGQVSRSEVNVKRIYVDPRQQERDIDLLLLRYPNLTKKDVVLSPFGLF